MPFKVTINDETREYGRKTRLLDILGDANPDKSIIAARVNNRVRELTYEVNYDCQIEWLSVKDGDAVKSYEASLRFLVAISDASLLDVLLSAVSRVPSVFDARRIMPGEGANQMKQRVK